MLALPGPLCADCQEAQLLPSATCLAASIPDGKRARAGSGTALHPASDTSSAILHSSVIRKQILISSCVD